jgi:hypothetical protein
LSDQENHHILKNEIVTSDYSFPTMTSSIEEGTLNLRDSCQTLQDIVSEVKEIECEFGDHDVSEVKEVEYEVGDHEVSNTSPDLFKQVQDQLVGDDIISQTSSKLSNSGNMLSHDFVFENISCSLKEHTMGVDQFIQ